MKTGSRRTVAVEDLLRLKRAERPSPEFWNEFDRRLREKQLSALMNPKPWWTSIEFAGIWAAVRRFQIPLGASAIITVTMLSWQLQRPGSGSEPGLNAVESITPIHSEGTMAVVAPTGQESMSSGVSTVDPMVESAPSLGGGTVDRPDAVEMLVASPIGLPRDIPLLGVPSAETAETPSAWSTRYETATGGTMEGAEIQVSRSLLSSVARFEARMPAVRPAVEPLQQMTPPAERRGARILTAMVAVGSVENAMRTTERAANRLSEERLYEQIQRFGARGAGVSVKF